MRRSQAIAAAVDDGNGARALDLSIPAAIPLPGARRLPRGAGAVLAATGVSAAISAALGATPLRIAGVAGLVAVVAGLLLHRRVTDRGSLDPVLVLAIG